MNIKKKRVTTLYVLVLSISILSCGCQYIKDSKNPKVISNNKGNLAENLDNKICVYYISLSSFRLSEVVCEDVSCYALGEKGIYYVSEDDGNVYYKTYQNSESIEKTAIENCSNSLLKYGDNGWLIAFNRNVFFEGEQIEWMTRRQKHSEMPSLCSFYYA